MTTDLNKALDDLGQDYGHHGGYELPSHFLGP